jgi:tetratricopeptide (TPR) repeat protein
MDSTRRLVSQVRRRISLIRFLTDFQTAAFALAGAALLLTVVLRVAGIDVGIGVGIGVVALGSILTALFRSLLRPVSHERAASEADRILGSRERISSALAVLDHRTEDPLGLLPVLSEDATAAVRGATPSRVAKALPLRLRRQTALTLALLAGLLLVPLVPEISRASAKDDAGTTREREQVSEQLKKFEKRLAETEELAAKDEQKKLEEMVARLRTETKRLAGDRPRRGEAVARMSKLEREAREEVRRFAGMKKIDPSDSERAGAETLKELGEALERFEKAAGEAQSERFTKLLDKLTDMKDMKQLTAQELAESQKAMQELTQAMESLEGLARETESERLMQMLEGMASREAMQRLAKAMAELQKAMKESMGEEERQELMKQMAEAMRDYRQMQLTDEEIEQMLAAMEELRKMIEAGEELSFCKSSVGGMLGMGGMGFGPGLPGLGRGGQAGGNGRGDGTGGRGTGRGGVPPKAPDDKAVKTELVPGKVSDEGEVMLIRNVRSLPSAEQAPSEYRRLVEASAREAEEALRRGDIPRRYREYVKRFFRNSEPE